MFADTGALRSAGTDLGTSAADIDEIAAALPSAADPCAAALGPIGAEFLAALMGALSEAARAASGLGADLSGAAQAAAVTSTAYVAAEHRSASTLGA